MAPPEPNAKKVLLAAVTRGRTECSIQFVTGVLRLQRDAAMLGAAVEVNFQPSVAAAVRAFRDGRDFDVAVVIDTWIGFPQDFVTRAVRELAAGGKDLIVGVYPMPHIDWDRVRAAGEAAGGTREPPEHWGNRYNVDVDGARVCRNDYLRLAAPVTDAKIFAMSRRVLEAAGDDDDDVVRAWHDGGGRDVYADLQAPCSNFGACEFAGCVGRRGVLQG